MYMDTVNILYRSNFSFTFTIPSKKVIWYKGHRMTFGKMKQEQQYDFLENRLQKINRFYKDIKWVYEEHQDGRLHIHGFIKNAYFEEVELFRTDFYKHPISITPSVYFRLSNIQETLYNSGYFTEYMQKNQNNIKYFMRSIQDKIDTHNLDDDKPVKIEYLFGKIKKHIIEI